MDLEMITTVSEVSPKEKDKYMISLISGILKKKKNWCEWTYIKNNGYQRGKVEGGLN